MRKFKIYIFLLEKGITERDERERKRGRGRDKIERERREGERRKKVTEMGNVSFISSFSK